MGIIALDSRKYGQLCADVVPKIIETDEEFGRMVEKMEEIDRRKNPSAEEEALSALLARLIEDYDDRNFPLPDVLPYKVVLYLMEHKGLRQADLLPVFGSRSVASDVLAGKRELSKSHIRKLSELFHLSPAAFF